MSNQEGERDRVKITHYINPHMFWFKYEAECFSNELFMWENKLQTSFFKLQKSPPSAHHPQKGEVIAVFIFSFNRWIRATCDFISTKNSVKKYYVWAIDYGMPFQVEDRWIRKMPSDIEEGPREPICFAGIMNVIPAQKTYNLGKLEAEMTPCKKWSPAAISTIETLIKEASEIRFISDKKSEDGQLFGNLIFTSQSKKTVKADMILQEINQAKKVPLNDFFNTVEKIGSNRVARWVTSSDDTPQALRGGAGPNDDQKGIEGAGTGQIGTESSSTEIDVARKFEDWEKRNEICRMQGDISIDDFSFNDSVSVCHLKKDVGIPQTQMKTECYYDEDDDPPIVMKAGVLRRHCLSKYQHHIPPPPSGNSGSIKDLESINENQHSPSSKTKEDGSGSGSSLVKSETKNDTKCKSEGDSKNTDTSVANAVQLLINRRANIRKSLISKSQSTGDELTNSISDLMTSKEKVSETPKEIKDNQQSPDKETAMERPKSLSSASPTSSTANEGTDRYKNKQSNRNVIPAGFDMRNLAQKSKPAKQYFGKNTNDERGQSSKWSPSNNDKDLPQHDTGDRRGGKFKSYNDASKVCLNTLDEMCLQTHLSKHLVLVHGKHVAKPIDKLKSANFCDEVHQELELMRINQIYRIQSYTWPHLMRGNSLVVVSSARTGRTLSYLPAICSLIKVESDEDLVPDTVGPIGIIVAPSSVEVERISKMCRRFLHGSATKIAIVESFGIRNMQKTTRYLLNGCEVLIATPPSLCRLIKNKIKLFDVKRIKHLIFDDIDFMQEDTKCEVHEILRFCCGAKSASVQMVVIAKYWSAILSGLLRMAQNTQLCIGAYIEAAVYARSLFKLKIIKKTSKTHELLQFMKAHPYLTERLIVVCNKVDELLEVVEALRSKSYFYIACSSDSTADEIELAKIWHQRIKGEMSVLVCTDDILPELKVSEAQNIVHYSLPQSWTRFSFRFSSMFGYFDDFVKLSIPVKTPPACLILLDENNNTQLPRLIHFLRNHKVDDIAEEIYTVCNRIKIQREEERINEHRQFCPYVMEFGKCFNIEDCAFRHELTKYDIPRDSLLVQGNIIFKVLEVISPTHYTVRLLEHLAGPDKSWTKIAGSQEYLKFNLTFAQYFSDTNNHQLHWPVEIGDLCVVSEGKTFHRAKIVHITKSKSLSLSTDVTCRIKLVDTGRIIACKSSHVLYLPEQFRDLPHQAVDLRLSGIIPYDNEPDWSTNATDIVEYWFKKYVTGNVNVIAKIKFALMDTIWVENIKIIEKLESIQTYVTIVNIKNSLLEKQFGTVNNDMEEVLKEKAVACGIFKNGFMESSKDCTEEKTKSCSDEGQERNSHRSVCSSVSSDELKKKVSQKYFDVETEDIISNRHVKESWEKLLEKKFTRVSIGAFYNPNHMYIQPLNDLKRNEELYKAIDEHILSAPVIVKNPKIGLNCLAKYEEKYNRAKITKVVCGGGSQDLTVSLFFCDIGMTSTMRLSEVFYSTKKLVEMLPFQAIRCKMSGISPNTYGLWTDDVCDQIYDDILDRAEYLYARAVKIEHPANDSMLKYWRYEVILLDCTSEKDININKRITELGLGSYDSDANSHLQPEEIMNPEDSSDDSSVESNWDDCNYVSPKIMEFNPNFGLDGLDVDVDIQFSQDDILQLLNLPPTAKILPPEPPKRTIKSIPAIKEEAEEDQEVQVKPPEKSKKHIVFKSHRKESASKLLKSGHNENLKRVQFESIQNKTLPALKTLFKFPQVFWQQSESLISLQIAAPDVEDYYLRVTSTTLVFIANIQNELRHLAINFCGCVDPSLISHNIRGLKVIIRLSKGLKGFFWPRLTSEGDKIVWLNYNYDSIIVEQETFANTGQVIRNSSVFDSSSDENCSDDDEMDLYGNDIYDPFD